MQNVVLFSKKSGNYCDFGLVKAFQKEEEPSFICVGHPHEENQIHLQTFPHFENCWCRFVAS